MSVFGRLFILFTAIPVLELWLLIRIGQMIGAGPTILIVILTGVAGAHLTRQQGLSVWLQAQQEMMRGQFPQAALIDGILLLVAGVTLITPGFLTDVLGFAILFPATRVPLRSVLVDWLRRHVVTGGPAGDGESPGDIPDYEVIDDDEHPQR